MRSVIDIRPSCSIRHFGLRPDFRGISGWVLFNLEEPLDFPDDLFSRRPRLCRRVEVNERQVSGAERGAPNGDNEVDTCQAETRPNSVTGLS